MNVRTAARELRDQYCENGTAAMEFGGTIHSLSSAIGHLKELAGRHPAVARHYASFLSDISDELAEMVGKMEGKLEAAE